MWGRKHHSLVNNRTCFYLIISIDLMIYYYLYLYIYNYQYRPSNILLIVFLQTNLKTAKVGQKLRSKMAVVFAKLGMVS